MNLSVLRYHLDHLRISEFSAYLSRVQCLFKGMEAALLYHSFITTASSPQRHHLAEGYHLVDARGRTLYEVRKLVET